MAKLTPKSSRKAVRRAWVEAMESGKYRKANGVLYDYENGAHCALGVLCDLAAKAKVTTKTREGFGPFDENSALPEEVRKWVGLRTESGDMILNGKEESIPSLNDGEGMSARSGKTLKTIAKIIRTCPVGFFEEDKRKHE